MNEHALGGCHIRCSLDDGIFCGIVGEPMTARILTGKVLSAGEAHAILNLQWKRRLGMTLEEREDLAATLRAYGAVVEALRETTQVADIMTHGKHPAVAKGRAALSALPVDAVETNDE